MNVINWIKLAIEHAGTRKAARKYVSLSRESKENLQVMEFRGDMYISYRGVPVVKVDDLNISVPDTLAVSREAYVNYFLEER